MHGTRMQSWSQIRDQYGRELVNLRNESRWVFLNTLFSVSEAVMYMQVCPHSDPCVPTIWLPQDPISCNCAMYIHTEFHDSDLEYTRYPANEVSIALHCRCLVSLLIEVESSWQDSIYWQALRHL